MPTLVIVTREGMGAMTQLFERSVLPKGNAIPTERSGEFRNQMSFCSLSTAIESSLLGARNAGRQAENLSHYNAKAV